MYWSLIFSLYGGKHHSLWFNVCATKKFWKFSFTCCDDDDVKVAHMISVKNVYEKKKIVISAENSLKLTVLPLPTRHQLITLALTNYTPLADTLVKLCMDYLRQEGNVCITDQLTVNPLIPVSGITWPTCICLRKLICQDCLKPLLCCVYTELWHDQWSQVVRCNHGFAVEAEAEKKRALARAAEAEVRIAAMERRLDLLEVNIQRTRELVERILRHAT